MLGQATVPLAMPRPAGCFLSRMTDVWAGEGGKVTHLPGLSSLSRLIMGVFQP